MTSPIDQAFDRCKQDGRAAFIPYLTAGFPNPSLCAEVLMALDAGGADVIEVGLPFSDPLADGPTIQESGRMALDAGMRTHEVLKLVSAVSSKVRAPIVLMTYVNPVFRMGYEEFASRLADAGVRGVIVPDLPPEEAVDWVEAADRNGLDTIFLVAPNTELKRVERVASQSKGFLYYVSMTGVTGSAFSVSTALVDGIHSVRSVSPIPVAVGFGISTADQGRALASAADGVIVGSELIRRLQNCSDTDGHIAVAHDMASSFTRAMIRDVPSIPEADRSESCVTTANRKGGQSS